MEFSRIFVLAWILIISSCCGLHTEVDYEYSDIVIKRIDVCGKTTFHYKSEQNKDFGLIWTKYSGINDGFSGYLVFSDNGKVTLFSGDGYFQSKSLDTSHFELKSILAKDRPQIGKNVCAIQLSNRYEKVMNDSCKSKIKVTYRIDKHEWW